MSLDQAVLAASTSSSDSVSFRAVHFPPAFFPASRASSQSGFTTNPPSPAITHTETDLSSWPSPRSPLDEWCAHNVPTYPPVPYPPATELEGIDPAWMAALNAGTIPPLSLSDTLESLGLGGNGPAVTQAGFVMSGVTAPLDDPQAIDHNFGATALKTENGFGIDATLTLPMETPWRSGAARPDYY